MNDRPRAARDFIAAAGWADATRSLLAGDASNRRYDRLVRPDGTRAVLMDAPADKGEDVRPFIAIAQHLTDAGLSAPRILHADTQAGFLLLEDLGDDLFARVLTGQPALEEPLYTAAVDVLVRLHDVPVPTVPAYDVARTVGLAALAFDWYQRGATGAVDDAAAQRFKTEFHALLAPLDSLDQVLILRDYHAENLLWLPERAGVARVGLLDFQDAMRGHAAYDLVSILQDARRDVSPAIEAQMVQHYVAQRGLDPDTFATAYALMGAQRNLRILGVFARLCLRDGKQHYVSLIPRVWAHVLTNLAHPALAPVSDLLRRSLPAPSPEILDRLRAQCATIPTP